MKRRWWIQIPWFVMAFIALLLFWFACGGYAAVVAGDKGHDGGIEWLVGGVVFGPAALLAAAGLGDRTQRRYLRLLVESQGVDLTPDKSSSDKSPNDDLDMLRMKRGW